MNKDYIKVGGGIYLLEVIGGVDVEEDEGMYETIVYNKKGEEMTSLSEFAEDFEKIEDCYGGQIKEQFMLYNNL